MLATRTKLGIAVTWLYAALQSKMKIKSEKFYSERASQQHIDIAQNDIISNCPVASVKI